MNHLPTFFTKTKAAERTEEQTVVLQGKPQLSPSFPLPEVTLVPTAWAHYPPRHLGGSGGHQRGFPGCWCPRSGSQHHPGPCFWLSANKKIPKEKIIEAPQRHSYFTSLLRGRSIRKTSDVWQWLTLWQANTRWFTFVRPLNCHKNRKLVWTPPSPRRGRGFTEIKVTELRYSRSHS